MNCPRKILTVCCIALLATPPALPQQPTAAAPEQQTDAQARIRVSTNLVVVPVTVKDSDGHLVPDLRREDFRILEDNVEQSIDVYSNDPFPLSVLIVIDNSLQKNVAQQVESTLPAIVGGLSDQDEAMVSRFDVNFRPGKGFTHDSDKLITELKRTRVESESAAQPPPTPIDTGPSINGRPVPGSPSAAPTTNILKGKRYKALDDALYGAADLLKDRGRERRKIVLLITDGEGAKKFTYSFEDAVKNLQQGDVSVFSVGVGNAYFSRKFSPLPKYAHATGGDVFYAERRESLEELYSRITEEARNQYTLAYVPRGTDRSLDYHSIEVRVKRPGLTIRTRDGYYAGAPPR